MFNPNMFQQFNLGQAATQATAVRRNHLLNQALTIDNEERANTIKNRDKARQIRAMFDGMPAQIEALEAEGLFEQADEMRDSYIRSRKTEVDLLTSLRSGITAENYSQFRQDLLQAGAVTPEMMPDEYSDQWFRKQIKEKKGALSKLTRQWWENGAILSQDLIQQDGEILWEGEPYKDPDNMPGSRGGKPSALTRLTRTSTRDGKEMKQDVFQRGGQIVWTGDWYAPSASGSAGPGDLKTVTRTSTINGRKMKMDVIQQDGQIVWEGDWYPADTGGGQPSKGSGAGFELGASDSNAIGRAAAELFGGWYDPQTGRISGLDKDTAQRVQAIREEAEKTFADHRQRGIGGFGHAVAVSEAARRLGINVQNVRNPSAADPLLLR